ncbi:MAG: glycosyltransferase [Bacteroidetes bacterium]|jgi:glycosyltransferase involved in cell wall biosynthesis|nr:glycosyltransferase [Bacteroidota bacterium]
MPTDMRVLAWPLESRLGNPYTRLLYGPMRQRGVTVDEFIPRRVLTGDYDVWHMHWPDGGFNTAPPSTAWIKAFGLVGLVETARMRGIRLVWTVHNLGAHETRYPTLERAFWAYLTRRLDGWVSLSEAGRAVAEKTFPALRARPSVVIPHGHYRDVYPDAVTREEARSWLGIDHDRPLIAHVGALRPYKNVPHLIHTARQLDRKVHLVVAGRPQTDGLARELREAAGNDPRIRLDLRFIPTDEVQYYLRAADLAVLPYTDILNSGSALLALSFDCPVLLPHRGAMGELQAQVGDTWVRTYEGPLTPAALQAALDWARLKERSSRAPLDDLSWEALSRRTLAFYRRVCGPTD